MGPRHPIMLMWLSSMEKSDVFVLKVKVSVTLLYQTIICRAASCHRLYGPNCLESFFLFVVSKKSKPLCNLLKWFGAMFLQAI